MPKPQKLITNYTTYPTPALTVVGWIGFEGCTLNKVKANPKLSLSSWKVSLQALDKSEITYNLEDSQENLRDLREKKLTVTDNLHKMAVFFNYEYENNVDMLHKTGLPLTGHASAPTALTKVRELFVGRGSKPGTVLVKWKRLRGVSTYLILYTANHEQPLADWRRVTTIGLAEYEIDALTSRADYHFCIVPLTKAVVVSREYFYSDSVSYVVQ